MPETALAGTIAAYIVLAILLLSLNIFSLWKWWLKAAAIVFTTACFVLAYFSITGMIGWPSSAKLPPRFSVLATRIVEPDKARGTSGHVYLWVEEIDSRQVPITPPRGYELPYTAKLADDTDLAQKKINEGTPVMGETGGGEEARPGDKVKKEGGGTDSQQGRTGLGTKPTGVSVAAETIGETQTIVFSDMPPVALPDKAAAPPRGD